MAALAVTEYVEATGDTSILDERTSFIEGPALPPDQEDAYLQPIVSESAATIYEHCLRAIERSRAVGTHGLPLMGGGDWNDGMNRVGHGGKGESVWMAWFLGSVLKRFAPVCESRGDADRAGEFRRWAERLGEAADTAAAIVLCTPGRDYVLLSLKVGTVSDPVKTQFGYHVIEVTKKTPGSTTTFEEAKAGIEDRLKIEGETAAWDKWVEEATTAAAIIYLPGFNPTELSATPTPASSPSPSESATK